MRLRMAAVLALVVLGEGLAARLAAHSALDRENEGATRIVGSDPTASGPTDHRRAGGPRATGDHRIETIAAAERERDHASGSGEAIDRPSRERDRASPSD